MAIPRRRWAAFTRGATVAAWYPITPATSVMDGFKEFCERFRKDKETGANNYLILQAEDELAAIGMVIGASWNGARAFTSTAGPGISLMNELLGLAYYAEIPAVVIDVQRVGPSTGMPTRTQQGDMLECAYASHGDTKHILLFPANPAECFEFAPKCFDIAEHFQTPVFMMSDLDIGMNDWVTPKLHWDDAYTSGSREGTGRRANWNPSRSSSAICRRTAARWRLGRYPGVSSKGSFFTRGSGHNKFGGYTEIPDEYQEVMDRLLLKHKEAAGYVPAPVIQKHKGARVGMITIGGCDPAVREALDILAGRVVRWITCASARFPSMRMWRRFWRARLLLCGGAESRRAAAFAADSGNARWRRTSCGRCRSTAGFR